MFASLRKFAALPPETLVCCGHEYTESNARFALAVDPGNAALQAYAEQVRATARRRARRACRAAWPTSSPPIPFLRAPDVAAFADLRARKDKF